MTDKPMAKKKWAVWGAVKATKFLGVFEADTKEEAERLAFESDAAHVSVCHQCADECSDPEIDTAIAEEETDDDSVTPQEKDDGE